MQPAASTVPMPEVQSLMRPGVLTLSALPPLALYVHFPWCVRKCPYCDFNSHEPRDGVATIAEEEYLDALCADLEASLPLIWGRRVVSVFIGGGTPSLLTAQGLARLLSSLRARLPLAPDCEITLEANPSSVEAQRFAHYRAEGVNRLSLGVQSFDEAMLKALGRAHNRAEALAAADVALNTFENVNLDLMHGLPGQSVQAACADLRTALGLGTKHVSLYQLTLEPNTVFAKHPPQLPDEDTLAAIQDQVHEHTQSAGLEHYEVSAYAQPGWRCQHNLNYWQFGDYLGIGPGAHSKLSFPHRVVRQVRLRQPDSYLRAARSAQFLAESTEVRRADLPFEFMLNALRLCEGVPITLFAERTGMPLSQIEREVQHAQQRGLLEPNPDRLQATALGLRFLNDLQMLFLSKTSAPK